MSIIKWKKLKYESKQIIRVLNLNLRLLIFVISVLFIFIIYQLTHNSLHLNVSQLFRTKFSSSVQKHFNSYDADENHDNTLHQIWSPESVETFRVQLGLSNYKKDEQNYECHVDSEYILSVVSGTEEEHLDDILWQYFSIQALAAQTIQLDAVGKILSFKHFVTNHMKLHLNHIFDGYENLFFHDLHFSETFFRLPLDAITSVPENCYNLKFAKIIGSKTSIVLKDISPETPFLLQSKAKRYQEIAVQWGAKNNPVFR